MAKYQVNESICSLIKEQQASVIASTAKMMETAGRCPYCKHFAGTIYKPIETVGIHAVLKTKCHKCGHEFVLPISFRVKMSHTI